MPLSEIDIGEPQPAATLPVVPRPPPASPSHFHPPPPLRAPLSLSFHLNPAHHRHPLKRQPLFPLSLSSPPSSASSSSSAARLPGFGRSHPRRGSFHGFVSRSETRGIFQRVSLPTTFAQAPATRILSASFAPLPSLANPCLRRCRRDSLPRPIDLRFDDDAGRRERRGGSQVWQSNVFKSLDAIPFRSKLYRSSGRQLY